MPQLERTPTEFHLTEAQIFAAETKRAEGAIFESSAMVSPVCEFDLDRFMELPKMEQTLLLMAARIYAVSTNSKVARSWQLHDVVRRLKLSRQVVQGIYHDPDVEFVAQSTHKDTQGNNYDFDLEMERDKFRYTYLLAGLTGNPSILAESIERLNKIIDSSSTPISKAAGIFDREKLRHQNENSRRSYKSLKKAHAEAIKISQEKENWERLSTISARFAIEAVRFSKYRDASKALANCARAAITDPSTRTILPRQVLQAVSEKSRFNHWQKQAKKKGKDYFELRLS